LALPQPLPLLFWQPIAKISTLCGAFIKFFSHTT